MKSDNKKQDNKLLIKPKSYNNYKMNLI